MIVELQRKDQLQEEANDDSDVDQSVDIENEEELQKELEELESQLFQFQQESNQLEAQLEGMTFVNQRWIWDSTEHDAHYQSALLELQTLKKENQAKRQAPVTPKKLTHTSKQRTPKSDSQTPKKSEVVTQEQLNELEAEEKRLPYAIFFISP